MLHGGSVIRGLTVNQLFSLRALLQHKSISVAAKECFVSQPAMSLTLKKLRDVFQDQLLIPDGKHFLLTDFSISLLPRIEDITSSLDGLTNKIKPFNFLDDRRKFILSAPAFYNHLIMKKCDQLNKMSNGNITFEVKTLNFCNLEVIEEESLDLCFTFDFFEPKLSPLLNTKVLLTDQTSCCVRKNGFLDDGIMDENKYFDSHHLVLKNHALSTGAYIDSLFLSSGKVRKIGVYGSSLLACMLALADGEDLVITGPESMLSYFSNFFPVSVYPLPFKIPNWQFRVIWHQRVEVDTGAMWLFQQFSKIGWSHEN